MAMSTHGATIRHRSSLRPNVPTASKFLDTMVPFAHSRLRKTGVTFLEFEATVTKNSSFDDTNESFVGSVVISERDPPVPMRIQSRFIPTHALEIIVVGTRVVVKGRVYLERKPRVFYWRLMLHHRPHADHAGR